MNVELRVHCSCCKNVKKENEMLKFVYMVVYCLVGRNLCLNKVISYQNLDYTKFVRNKIPSLDLN